MGVECYSKTKTNTKFDLLSLLSIQLFCRKENEIDTTMHFSIIIELYRRNMNEEEYG